MANGQPVDGGRFPRSIPGGLTDKGTLSNVRTIPCLFALYALLLGCFRKRSELIGQLTEEDRVRLVATISRRSTRAKSLEGSE